MSRLESRMGLTAITAAFVVTALVLAIGATGLSIKALTDVSAQGQRSCEVQSRGLEASVHLLQVWKSIDFFIEPHGGLGTSAPLPPMFAHATAVMRYHLPRYIAIQEKQPIRRHC